MAKRNSQIACFRLALLLLIGFLCVEATSACTVNIIGPREEFRRSKRIFVGEVISVEDIRKDKLPRQLAEDWDLLLKITFRVKQAWKGSPNGLVEVYSNVSCDCPHRLLRFEPGKQFIIYSDKNSFATACSFRISDIADVGHQEELKKDIAQLNSFWFRAWARVYPF